MTGPAGLVAKRAALERRLALRVDRGKLPMGFAGNLLVVEFFRKMSGGQWEPICLGNQMFKEWKCMGNFEGFPVNSSALLFGYSMVKERASPHVFEHLWANFLKISNFP